MERHSNEEVNNAKRILVHSEYGVQEMRINDLIKCPALHRVEADASSHLGQNLLSGVHRLQADGLCLTVHEEHFTDDGAKVLDTLNAYRSKKRSTQRY